MKNIDNFPYKLFKEFTLCFIDDVAVFTDKDPDIIGSWNPMDLHFVALDLVFHCLQKSGFKTNLSKSTIATNEFVFLGLNFNMSSQSFGINRDRVKSILDYRCPRSIAEVSSRLGAIQFFESHVLLLKRVSLSLYALVKSGVRQWHGRI
jgi:hypothetical protein